MTRQETLDPQNEICVLLKYHFEILFKTNIFDLEEWKKVCKNQ